MASDPKLVPLRPPRSCPICGKRAAKDAYPFCSKRCADLDLGRWLAGRYVIPGREEEEEDGRPDPDLEP
ncbi:DNA gyrase inhibitor YacG [Propylenella binzhouense]|uniref:DNA gyrase inhibitor YacG n=1 Tax=Propylenella binzhouense TaxID=2555902 RepID=A0A964T1N5_9HYPH|nr:DNA gyrase inhibitor YacG [Propylenella binzhouense]MYZ46808.1 DNA gyrase inhibitor YacG [Propylenella binzhouense]